MTAVSTLVSVVMLPLNLVLYTRWTYSADVVKSLDWTALFVSLVTVCTGIACGLAASSISAKGQHAQVFHKRANRLGNLAGLALITLSVTVSSSDHQAAIWDQNASFYVGVALPAFVGLGIAVYLSSRCALAKPERVAVSVEACYQNTGIATSVALTMFKTEEDLATAIGVPLYYGIVEAVMLACFCLVCWKLDWTKAPSSDNLCKVLTNSYEVEEDSETEQDTAIEVVLGEESHEPNNLIFEQTEDGAYIVDENSLQHIVHNNSKGHASGIDMESPTLKGGLQVPDDTECHTEHSETSADGDEVGGGLSPRRRPYTALQAPSSPTVTESTNSSGNETEDDGTASATPTSKDGRLGRTISTLRARATGYRKTPLPEGASFEDDTSIQVQVPSLHVDTEEPSSTYASIPVTSPLSSVTEQQDEAEKTPANGKTLD